MLLYAAKLRKEKERTPLVHSFPLFHKSLEIVEEKEQNKKRMGNDSTKFKNDSFRFTNSLFKQMHFLTQTFLEINSKKLTHVS